jgi:uncharacterized damage-inducible protein DinB
LNAWFGMLADYNAWANARLYEAAAAVPDAEYRADHGVFFRSLHGTLNHLLLGDRIWMHRFTGGGEGSGPLDAILYPDLPSLRIARQEEDRRIVRYVGSLSDSDLAGTIRYRSTRSPADIEQVLGPLLLHFFNHQTHHRGQAHAILTRVAGEAPSFDLFVFQRQTGASVLSGGGGDFSRPEQRPGARAGRARRGPGAEDPRGPG